MKYVFQSGFAQDIEGMLRFKTGTIYSSSLLFLLLSSRSVAAKKRRSSSSVMGYGASAFGCLVNPAGMTYASRPGDLPADQSHGR